VFKLVIKQKNLNEKTTMHASETKTKI